MVQVGIQWGWRIPCAQAGCTKVHEVWASRHTPQCPWGLNEDGWFHWRRRSSDYALHTWIAYCPEYADKPKEWLAKRKKWINARWDAARTQVPSVTVSMWQKLKDAFSNVEAETSYQLWLKANPYPYAPWDEPFHRY